MLYLVPLVLSIFSVGRPLIYSPSRWWYYDLLLCFQDNLVEWEWELGGEVFNIQVSTIRMCWWGEASNDHRASRMLEAMVLGNISYPRQWGPHIVLVVFDTFSCFEARHHTSYESLWAVELRNSPTDSRGDHASRECALPLLLSTICRRTYVKIAQKRPRSE